MGSGGLVSAPGAGEVAGGLGVQDLLSHWRCRCAALPGLPPSAQLQSEPLVPGAGAPTPTPLSPCAAGAHPQDPLLHQSQVSLSWTAPALAPEPVHSASASVAAPTPSPFPGCATLEPQGELRLEGERWVPTADPGADACTTFLLGSGTLWSRWLCHQITAALRRREEARPASGPGGTTPGHGVSGCARAVPL